MVTAPFLHYAARIAKRIKEANMSNNICSPAIVTPNITPIYRSTSLCLNPRYHRGVRKAAYTDKKIEADLATNLN